MSHLVVDRRARKWLTWERASVDRPANPMVTTSDSIEAGGVSQTIAETAGPTITVTRTP